MAYYHRLYLCQTTFNPRRYAVLDSHLHPRLKPLLNAPRGWIAGRLPTA
jgi:hypothetical protein